ncbi:MAG: hypothetical protein RI946_1451 [Pseudomonadota bacterium]
MNITIGQSYIDRNASKSSSIFKFYRTIKNIGIDPNGMLVINSSIPSGASQIESAAGKGIYKFWVNANDGDGVTAKSEVTINVSNVDPSPTDTIASASVKDGQSSGAIIDISTHFADTDRDTGHIYSIINTDNTITDLFEIDATTGVISIKDGASIPINASTTSGYTITVQISDKEGGITTKDVTITVAGIAPVAVTDPVTVEVTDAQTAGGILDAGDLFTDGDDLEFSMTGGPDWLVIDPISGAVSIAKGGVPAGASVNGPITITIQVDDGEGGVTTKDVTIDVANANIKTVGTLPPVTATKNADITIDTNIFVDPDGDVLTFSAAGLPDGLSIDPATGLISGKLGTSVVAGTAYVITITVTDSQGSVVSKTFSLNTKSASGANSGEVARNVLPDLSSKIDHTLPSIQVKNVIIDAARSLGLNERSNAQIDVGQPIIATVNGLGSLASSADVDSTLPISNLVQDKILNDADRRYIDVALKDPASSGRVFRFNAPDQGDLIATLIETENERRLELISTLQGDLRIVDKFPLQGVEVDEDGTIRLSRAFEEQLISLTVEIDVQGTLTVRDILVNPATGELEEISREQRGRQFSEMLNWQAVMF